MRKTHWIGVIAAALVTAATMSSAAEEITTVVANGKIADTQCITPPVSIYAAGVTFRATTNENGTWSAAIAVAFPAVATLTLCRLTGSGATASGAWASLGDLDCMDGLRDAAQGGAYTICIERAIEPGAALRQAVVSVDRGLGTSGSGTLVVVAE